MSNSHQIQDEPQKSKGLSSLFLQGGKHLLKQSCAALVCGLLVWGMQSGSVPLFQRYASALGNALRYESDFSFLLKAGQAITEKVSDLFQAPADTPPLPEEASPADGAL